MSAVTPEPAGDLAALRREIAGRALQTAEVERVWRHIGESGERADVRVAWLGNHTLEPVLRHASVLAFAHDVTLANHAGDFGQHFQAVLDPGSGLHAWKPDAIVLSLSLRALAPGLVTGGAGLPEHARRADAERALDHARRWVKDRKSVV